MLSLPILSILWKRVKERKRAILAHCRGNTRNAGEVIGKGRAGRAGRDSGGIR